MIMQAAAALDMLPRSDHHSQYPHPIADIPPPLDLVVDHVSRPMLNFRAIQPKTPTHLRFPTPKHPQPQEATSHTQILPLRHLQYRLLPPQLLSRINSP